MMKFLEYYLIRHVGNAPQTAARVKGFLRTVGYEPMHWVRAVMYEKCSELISELGPERLDVCEISAGNEWRSRFNFKSYTELNYPEFDICKQTASRQFDLVIADNVFEHLLYPYRAARNVLKMLRPGGYFLNITPFMIRVHAVPTDCSRWTEEGMKYFLEECGFDAARMISGSWGNRACVKANFPKWARVGFSSSMKNEPDFPVQVWVLARAPG